MSTRLIPPRTESTQPYWDAAARGELVVQQCGACNFHVFPPRANCPACGSSELSWKPVTGQGTIYTYTVAHRAPHPVLAEQCPFTLAVVELEEGPRLMTNIIGCNPEDVEVGMRVQVAYEDIDDSDVVLPVFKPA